MILANLRIAYLWDLVYELVMRDLKVRYKRSTLGLMWSMLNPLLQLMVFRTVFTHILPLGIPNYTNFLFTGLLSWTWFSAALFSATSSITDNPSMIRHPGFPVAILPVVTVASNMVNFLLAVPILLAFLVAGGNSWTGAMAALPLVVAVQFLLIASLAYLLAAMHVPFRDTQYLLGISLMLGFYITPVFYQPAAIPHHLSALYYLNPMAWILTAYRDILLRGVFPDLIGLAGVALCSTLLFAVSYRLFLYASRHFAEQL